MLFKDTAQRVLAQTSVINGDTQVHAVVTPAPGTGKFVYTSSEIGKYPWLNRKRPYYEFALSKGLQPDFYAHDSKCRLLFIQPGGRPAGNTSSRKLAIGVSESPRSVSDETIFPVGEGRYNSMPTLAWLDEPFKRDKTDSCKRKVKKRDGTDHLKAKIIRRVTKAKPNKQRNMGSDVDMPPIVSAALAIMKKEKKEEIKRVAPKAPMDRQQTGEVTICNIHRLLKEEEVVWKPWAQRPRSSLIVLIMKSLRLCHDPNDANHEVEMLAAQFNKIVHRRQQGENVTQAFELWSNDVLSLISRWCSDPINVQLNDASITRFLSLLRKMDPIYDKIDEFLFTSHHDNRTGALMGAFGSMRSCMKNLPFFDSWFTKFMAPRAQIHVLSGAVPRFRDFRTVGTPPNWFQGGSANLAMRAVAWYCTDFSRCVPVTDYVRVRQALVNYPCTVPIAVSQALDGVESAEDIDEWLEANAYQNRDEYTTLLENLLQRPIPYWNKIEPVLISFQTGMLVFQAMRASTSTKRIMAAMGVVVATYTQHALASRNFVGLLKDASSLLYKAVLRVVSVLENIWARFGSDREQSLFESGDVMQWFTKISSCIDSEFQKKLLQAIAVVGAVVTCPWKTLSENSVTAWASKVLDFLSNSATAAMKKMGFIEKFFELVKFFFLRARLAWTYKDFGLFFYGRDEFNALISKVNTLVDATKMLPYMSTTWSATIVNGVPYNVSTYEALIKEIGDMARQIEGDVRARKIVDLPSSITSALSRYAICVSTYEAFRKNQRNRPLPFVIPMVGPPSAGKNTLLEEIVEKLFKVCKFPLAIYDLVDGVPTYVRHEYRLLEPCTWTANAFDEYASGFTNLHNVVNFIEPTLAQPCTADGIKHGFSQLASFFSFVDTAPYSPVMAAVDDKGKMSASGVLVATVSANDDSFNKWMLSCQMALLRRLGYLLVIHPWADYKDKVTGGLDKSTIRETEFKTDDDMWYFEVKKPVARGSWNVRDTSVHADWELDTTAGHGGYFYTVQDLMDWLVRRLTNHFSEQTMVMTKADKARKAECCSRCYRFGHTSSAHCETCGGLACPGGLSCVSVVSNPLQLLPSVCCVCGCDKTVGCSACSERDAARQAHKLGITISKIVKNGLFEEFPGGDYPSHCAHCYRMCLAPLLGNYTCYGCSRECSHSLRRFFLQGLTVEPHCVTTKEGIESLISVDSPSCDVANYLESKGGAAWVHKHVCDAGTPEAHRYGAKQQMGHYEIACVTGGVAAGFCLAYGLKNLMPTIRIQHSLNTNDPHVRAVCRGIGYAGEATRTVFRLPLSDGIEYPASLPDISESLWFNWAKTSVSSFASMLKSLSLSDWMTLTTIASLIVVAYGVYRYQDRGEERAVVMKKKGSPINIAAQDAKNLEEQSGIFDSEFITSVLARAGLTTGARPSSKSDVRIDNPWLDRVSIGVHTNLGKRTGYMGTKQCIQACERISRSIYKIGGIIGTGEAGVSKGLHNHAMLLGGCYFVTNAHFIIGTFARQVAHSKQLVGAEYAHMVSNLMMFQDWSDFRSAVEAHGVHAITLVYGAKFSEAVSGGDPGPGITSEVREIVHFDQIAGCIFSDVAVVKFARTAPHHKAGLFYDINNLSRGLCLPKEHNAPSLAVLHSDGRTYDESALEVATAVYAPNMQTEISDVNGKRRINYEAWSMMVKTPTDDGDCGLPLIGVFSTKYIDDADAALRGERRKIADPSGDVIAILGMHRLYSPSRSMIHCAPLSIDIISLLMGKLDAQLRDIQQVGSYDVYTVRTFGSGEIPTHVPVVAEPLGRDVALQWDNIEAIKTKPIVFKSGSQNVYHDKSPLQWMGKGNFLDFAPELGEARALHGEGVGSVSGFRQGHFSSSVTRLPLANFFSYEQKHFAPNLNDRRGKERNLVAMSGATNGNLDIPLLGKVKSDLVYEILDKLDRTDAHWRNSVHPLSDFETVVGSSDANFTPGVNRTTGMGFPFYGSKQAHIGIDRDSHGVVSNVTVRDEVLSEIGKYVRAYSDLERANPVFTATPKDERIGGSKIVPLFDINRQKKGEVHDIRIFLCGSYPFVHLQRQQYLSVIRLICEKPEIFGMAVGTNVASARWGLMRDWLTWGGQATNTILAGDYSKFDKRMTSTWIIAAFEILLSIMAESGNYCEGDMRIAEGIAWDTAVPLIDWFGDWFFITNGHPSGHALTTIINGLVNRLYLRYAYYILWGSFHNESPRCCTGMSDCVRTYVYGDDNISGVRGEAVWFYTMPRICTVLQEVGVILTTEDKTTVINDFTDIDSAGFLKRTWRFVDGRWTAPLARKSLEAMVTIGVLSKTDPTTQMYQILRSFLDEHYHYGREEFCAMRSRIINLFNDPEYWAREGFPLIGTVMKQQWAELGDKFLPDYDAVAHRWEHAGFVPMC